MGMTTFKLFFENQTLGLIEPMSIEGVGKVNAKVDSGNGGYNVLHGVNIKINDDKATFKTIDGVVITKPIVEFIDINIGSGNIEKRPVVAFNISINNKYFKNIKFSIADRSQNEEKVLLGKNFIAALGGLIDVTK
jgi:hypothetical protein